MKVFNFDLSNCTQNFGPSDKFLSERIPMNLCNSNSKYTKYCIFFLKSKIVHNEIWYFKYLISIEREIFLLGSSRLSFDQALSSQQN